MLVPALVAVGLATAAPTAAGALRAEATEAYRARRYAEACRKFGEAARVAPEDAALAADLGLCLHRQGNSAEAIAETRRAIRFAKPDGAVARRVRRSAYYNLSLMGGALEIPDPGSCAPLERAPGCDRAVHGCTHTWSAFGTGGGESGTWLVVALEAAGATIDGAQDRARERPAVADPRYDDPSPQDPPTESAILILSEETESFGNANCDASDADWVACTGSKEATAAARRCVVRKGCKGSPVECGAWEECVSAHCAKVLSRREEECRRKNRPWSSAFGCTVVHADACMGIVASVCDKYAPDRPPPVHEVRLKPRGR